MDILVYTYMYVRGSAKTCQDERIFENHFWTFYNSVVQDDYNALCFTSVACPLRNYERRHSPCTAEERLE